MIRANADAQPRRLQRSNARSCPCRRRSLLLRLQAQASSVAFARACVRAVCTYLILTHTFRAHRLGYDYDLSLHAPSPQHLYTIDTYAQQTEVIPTRQTSATQGRQRDMDAIVLIP